MVARILTAAAVKKLQAGSRRLEIPDGGSGRSGLRLVIQVSGHKSFAMRFRRPDGRSANLTLGPVDLSGNEMSGEPAIGQPLTLAAARKLAASIARDRAMGRDPVADFNASKRRRRTEGEQRAALNFAVVARRYIEEYARPRTRSWAVGARMLGLSPSTLEPVKDGLAQRWRDRTIGEITVDDVDAVLTEIRTKGTPGMRTRTAVSDSAARVALLRYSKFFAWAIEKRLITINPTASVGRPPPGASRERVLSDAEIKLLWRACDHEGAPFGPLVKFILLTGQRRGECAGLRWSELDGDVWHLPAERSKNGKAHTVPLSALALEQIHGVKRIGTEYAFTTTGDVPLAGFSRFKRRLDARMVKLAGGAVPPWTVHDLRRTAATNLQKLGVRLEVTEACLNHVSGSRSGIVSVYQKYKFEPEKRAALNAWADHLAVITRASV